MVMDLPVDDDSARLSEYADVVTIHSVRPQRTRRAPRRRAQRLERHPARRQRCGPRPVRKTARRPLRTTAARSLRTAARRSSSCSWVLLPVTSRHAAPRRVAQSGRGAQSGIKVQVARFRRRLRGGASLISAESTIHAHPRRRMRKECTSGVSACEKMIETPRSDQSGHSHERWDPRTQRRR